MSTRVLVLTSSTGSGHDMRARAFASWVRSIHGESVEVRIEQIIENSSIIGRFGVWLYNTIHKKAPYLHNIYFFIVEVLIFTHNRSVSFGGRYYRNLVTSFRPDIVFSVHDSTNRGYFEDARKLLGDTVRCVTYCGEFSGGYGYSRNWVNPSADLFIARTEAARKYAVKLGVPHQRTSVFHKLLPPEAFQPPFSEDEKTHFRQHLGLSSERFTLFLATGGYGANHHLTYLKALLPLADRVQVIIVCGRNAKVLRQISNWTQAHPELTAFVEGYSSHVAGFLQISQAVVTRGGANTSMEALHYECPLLYDALGGLMPQEQCTVRYFLERKTARLIRSAKDLREILSQWCAMGPLYHSFKQQLRDLNKYEEPHQLIQQVLDKAAPAKPKA